MRTQKCSNQDYTGANCHPRKLYGRKRRLKPNSSKRKKGSNRTATNPVQHDDRSLHRNAYDVSKQHQNKIRRKSHTSPKAKNRPLAASNDPGRAFRQKAEDIERSRGKCEMHKEVGNWSKRQSQGREEADETGSSVAARTARRPESKAVPRASYEIDGERIEERPQPKLERNSRRPIAGSRAYVTDETEEMHAIRGESDTRKKNRADMPHLASARAHINDADTNINSKRNTGGEQTRSDENGAQVPGCTSVRGSKDRERRKVEHREQSKGKPKERKETDVEEDSSPEAVLPHSQATLQRESEMGSDVLCEMGDVGERQSSACPRSVRRYNPFTIKVCVFFCRILRYAWKTQKC
ncbi:uncharacterized protein EMH_0066340 [Eimeria mitis]|uniref:Uncharacterized protein n=1 Tax=Eimeria mitis TaxID=44415 RepID=U6KLB6_9EIME|nr:uncharacterized protein EMH_0066340 [Eimeria mitis]CDJ36248.1 hypothetical protein, conserved [Eimeria mitis]